MECLQAELGQHCKYDNVDLVWSVTLNTFGDDSRVVDLVCGQLRSEGSSGLAVHITMNPRLLASVYPVDSPHNGRVSAAIEDRVHRSTNITDYELFGLATVDHGPKMKRALLDDLLASSWPHWAADSLAEFFSDDGEAHAALRSVLMGDPVRASKIANVATKVLDAGETIPRLLAILRKLGESARAGSERYDFVASALVQSRREQGIGPGPELEAVATEALALMSTAQSPVYGDPRYEIAAGFYPSEASREILADLADVQDCPLVPYLRAFRDEPEQTRSWLGKAATILRSLPAYLRGRVCESLADRAITPELILHLTRRWADDVSKPNKSIASLAYHRGLLKHRQEGHIDDCEWNSALTYLGEQASCYGPDHPARRRAAWVGMCVCKEWSVLEGRVETIGEADPVGVSMADPLYGPDGILLQQIASRWEDLRTEFGDTLLPRLSGVRARQRENEVWDLLALVAPQNVTLQQELERAVTDNPELLKLNGVLAWFVTRRNRNTDTVADALVSRLRAGSGHGKNLASAFLAEPERISLPREELQSHLENALSRFPAPFGDPALEALALLDPENPAVHAAWQEYSAIIANRRNPEDHPINARTYSAVACAAADASQILNQVELHLKRLDKAHGSYYESSFARHISHRLRRDAVAADTVRDAVMNPTTPDSRAALLVSILADAVSLDPGLLGEVDRRLAAQNNVALAPFVRDHTVSATLSVRTIFTRAKDTAWEMLSR